MTTPSRPRLNRHSAASNSSFRHLYRHSGASWNLTCEERRSPAPTTRKETPPCGRMPGNLDNQTDIGGGNSAVPERAALTVGPNRRWRGKLPLRMDGRVRVGRQRGGDEETPSADGWPMPRPFRPGLSSRPKPLRHTPETAPGIAETACRPVSASGCPIPRHPAAAAIRRRQNHQIA